MGRLLSTSDFPRRPAPGRRSTCAWLLVACAWLVMGGVALPIAHPSAEGDAEGDPTELSIELVLCAPHSQERRDPAACDNVGHAACCGGHLARPIAACGRTTRGHRLANGLCAPLRC